MLARCDLLRLLRERGRQEDAWVSGGHVGKDKQLDTLLSSQQWRTNIREDAITHDLKIRCSIMSSWWTVNGADKAYDQASDGCYGMMANRRLRAPKMRDEQPYCDFR